MSRAIVIAAHDNVATALDVIAAGQTIDAGGRRVTARERIASGHKVALTAIAAGEAVVKFGSPIGTATADIPAGAHVHVHNLAGNRGRGDRAPDASVHQDRR
jgi:altronate hydrolase